MTYGNSPVLERFCVQPCIFRTEMDKPQTRSVRKFFQEARQRSASGHKGRHGTGGFHLLVARFEPDVEPDDPKMRAAIEAALPNG